MKTFMFVEHGATTLTVLPEKQAACMPLLILMNVLRQSSTAVVD
ncbi:hypothetical protein [Thermosporothrix hazakensis]|nr:hypothetical protein [Thermosporothrix hazakensis]